MPRVRQLAILLLALFMFLMPFSAFAADIEIGADCTLANAIASANADAAIGGCPAGDGADTIVLGAEVILEAALPPITSEISIVGNWNTISGAESFRIFLVDPAGALTINEASLTKGKTDGRGGAIYNRGTLSLIDSSVSGSSARRFGGAIANWGVATIKDSSFRANQSRYGGAIYNRGGATLSIDGGAFLENAAQLVDGSDEADSVIEVFGGAIYNHGSVDIIDSSFSDNISEGDAAAIANLSQATVADTTFITNSAGLDGGAITSSGSIAISESTFIENIAKGNYGGVIVNHGSAQISETDFINNLAPGSGGALANWGAATIEESDFTGNTTETQGGAIFNVGEIGITDSKLRDNASGNGGAIHNLDSGIAAIIESDFTGNTSEGYGGAILNLSEAHFVVSGSDFRDNMAGSGGGALFTAGAAQVIDSSFRDNTTPGFGGALANGAALILTGSSFRDNIADEDEGGGLRNFGALEMQDNKFASNSGGDCVGCDGEPVVPAGVDFAVGAASSGVRADIVVRGDCTLEQAIQSANVDRAIGGCAAGDGPDSIGLTADITLAAELPHIESEISIEGNGHTISGNNKVRIFLVQQNGSLSISDMTLTKGKAVRGSGEECAEYEWGGAICVEGALNVTASAFIDNRARYGGAIFVNSGRKLNVADSDFRNNTANSEGGAISNYGTVTQTGNTFTGNTPNNCYNC